MTRPSLPAPGPNDVWGVQLNAAINAVSDAADSAASDASVASIVADPTTSTRSNLNDAYRTIRATAHHQFAGKADGNPSPVLDSGQTSSLFTGTQTAGVDDAWTVRSGTAGFAAYSGTAPTDGANHAIYWQTDTGKRVTRVQATATWPATSSGSASLDIVVPSAAWVGRPTPSFAPAGVHFVANGNGQWHVSYFNSGSGESIYAADTTPGQGRYAAVTNGQPATFELFIDPDASTVEIFFPDGTTSGVISDSRIAANTSTLAIVEVFIPGAAADVPPVVNSFAADTQVTTFDSAVQNRPAVAAAVQANRRVVHEYDSSAGSLITGGSVPHGCLGAYVDLIAPGGGGGSGARMGAGVLATGGASGGSGGTLRRVWVPASALSSSFNVNVPAGGTGGAAVTVDSTAGAAGSAPGNAVFTCGSVALRALGPGGGAGGTNTGAAAGGGAGAPLAVPGISSSAAGAAGPNGGLVTTGAPGQAGAGGGVTTGDVAGAGGNGSSCYLWGTSTGGTGGVVGGAAPTGGTAARQADRPGDGPGGGAASTTAAAQAGADGVGHGVGGGGGGASRNGFASGAGGKGGPGYARIEFVLI